MFRLQEPENPHRPQEAPVPIQGKITVHIMGDLDTADLVVLALHVLSYCNEEVNLLNKQHNHQHNHQLTIRNLTIHQYLCHYKFPHFMSLLPLQTLLLPGSYLFPFHSQQQEDAMAAMHAQLFPCYCPRPIL